jgi:serine/threonine protein kinase
MGLANEAKLLTQLKHENIVQLHGISQECLSKVYLDKNGYFLVLERLDYTLEDEIKRLKIKEQPNTAASDMKRFCFRGDPSLTMAQKCRLQDIIIPIISALQYLHKKHIIYRDLKPANIAFDADNGTPKLLDFGLALEIVESGRRMTPTSGSLRYMSPENAISGDYGFSTDVYSFGLLLWEVMTLETPFLGITKKVFFDSVVKTGVRPKLDKRIRSKSIRSLIRQCWDPSQEIRPTFEQVMKVLQSEVLTDNSSGQK